MNGSGGGTQSLELIELPVLRVERHGDRHSVRDLTVSISCDGVLAPPPGAETILRTAARALSVDPAAQEVEALARTIARHCSTRLGLMSRIDVDVHERPWGRLEIGGRPREADLVQGAGPTRLGRATIIDGREVIAAGFRDLRLMTPRLRDPGQVELLRLQALWRYGWAEVPYDTQWHQVRRALTEAYVESDGSRADLPNVIALAILAESPAVDAVELRIERVRRNAVDMHAFGMENTGELYGDTAGGRYVQVVRVQREELPA